MQTHFLDKTRAMPPRQLRCHDLRGGDIMLQLNAGNLAHRVIAFAQWAARQRDSHVIHVGIMRGESYMIESEKRGIWAADLRVQDKDYGYLVYRPRNPFRRRAPTRARATRWTTWPIGSSPGWSTRSTARSSS